MALCESIRIDREIIHKGLELEKEFLASDVVLAVIGISILLLSVTPVPYVTTSLEEVTHSSVWLDKSLAVPALSRAWLTESFFVPDFSNNSCYGNFSYLRIEFRATDNGNPTVVTFQVLNETNFLKMKAGEQYQDLGYPSQYNVFLESAEWVPPNDTKIYFVCDNSSPDNTSRFTSKSVSVQIWLNWMKLKIVEKTENRTLLPSGASIFGVLILVIGLLIISKLKHSRLRIAKRPDSR